jgi:hypothetical protein
MLRIDLFLCFFFDILDILDNLDNLDNPFFSYFFIQYKI